MKSSGDSRQLMAPEQTQLWHMQWTQSSLKFLPMKW